MSIEDSFAALLIYFNHAAQIKEKRLHVPLIDRLPDEPPPRLVVIVGPPGVGKTTLL
jgi:GTP-binding protein required for 40S ribosome biogenesis